MMSCEGKEAVFGWWNSSWLLAAHYLVQVLAFTCTSSLPPEKPYLFFELLFSFVLQFPFTLHPFLSSFIADSVFKVHQPSPTTPICLERGGETFFLRGHCSISLYWESLFSSVAFCSAALSHIPAHLSPYIWGSPSCLEKRFAIIPAEPMWSETIILFKLKFKNKILSIVIIVLH